MKRTEFVAELKGLSAGALRERAVKLAEELMRLRFRKAATGQLEQSHRLRGLRRNIARVNTLLTLQQETQPDTQPEAQAEPLRQNLDEKHTVE